MNDKSGRGKVCIVEDDPSSARYIELILKKAKYEITGIIASGKEVFSHIDKHQPDLILMDIMLQGSMDGIEIAAAIKKNHSIPVIYLTALSDEDILLRATETNAYGYLLKPIEPKQLLSSVEVALSKHKLEAQLWESQTLLSRTLSSITDGVCTTDANGIITLSNQVFQKMSGKTADEILGKHCSAIIRLKYSESEHNEYFDLCEQSKSKPKGQSYLNTFDLEFSDKENIPVDVVATPLKDRNKSIGMVFVFRDVSQKRKSEAAIRQYQRQLQDFSDNLRNVQENERRRLAQEIHDELGQYLARIKMDLTSIKRRIAEEHQGFVMETADMVDQVVKKVRHIASELRPRILDDLGLEAAIDWLISDLSKRHQLNITFTGPDEWPEICADRATDLFRIVQESLTNILKHSGADEISIVLMTDAGNTKLIISDNGHGFSIEELDFNAGMGIIGMRERARRWGGTFRVESSDEGTKILTSIPLKAENKESDKGLEI